MIEEDDDKIICQHSSDIKSERKSEISNNKKKKLTF